MHPEASFIELEPRGGLYFKKKLAAASASSTSTSTSSSSAAAAAATAPATAVATRWMPASLQNNAVYTVGGSGAAPGSPSHAAAADNSERAGGDVAHAPAADSENKFRLWSWKRSATDAAAATTTTAPTASTEQPQTTELDTQRNK